MSQHLVDDIYGILGKSIQVLLNRFYYIILCQQGLDKFLRLLVTCFHLFINFISEFKQFLTERFKFRFFISRGFFNFLSKQLEELIIQAAARHTDIRTDAGFIWGSDNRSEEHTSELQSLTNLV